MAANLETAASQSQAQNASALKQVFKNLDAQSCPHTFNFHVHTVCSDGKLQPQALIEQAIAVGLKGLAITDHHSVQGYRQAQGWLLEQPTPSYSQALPHLWTGVEINANLFNTEVHILGYAFDPDHPALEPYIQGQAALGHDLQARQVITAIHRAGGLAVLAHPARYRRPATDLIPAAVDLGIDGVEAYYAYNNPIPWQPSPRQTQEVKQLSARYRLLNTCGTDTHGLSLLQRL